VATEVIEEDLDRRAPIFTADYKYITVALTASEVTVHTTLDDEDLVLCDCALGNITITLPSAADKIGKEYRIKKIDSTSNQVIITPAAGEYIDDDDELIIDSQYDSPDICSDGSNWYII
jgi:hypothetical protein